MLLKGEHATAGGTGGGNGFFARFHGGFERGFERLREGYVELLTILLTRRIIIPLLAILVFGLGAVMFVFVGRDFFPAIDGGRSSFTSALRRALASRRPTQIFQAVERQNPRGHP